MNFKKILNKTTVTIIALIAVTAVLVWIIWANKALELSEFTISDTRLPSEFDGFRIAHISDLHNTQLGKDNKDLIRMLKETKPDMIAITGDLIDSRNTDISVSLKFAEEAVKIAPCYYVNGNHEARVPEYEELKAGLEKAGVHILENQKTKIELNGNYITIIGVNDPSFESDYLLGDSESVMDKHLISLHDETDSYTVLLSHRPELFEIYVKYGIDLILSGHAHGGQFRFPFIGGIFAPNQGFFPQYDSGLYSKDGTSMIVSRGLGPSVFPLRLNNRPELVLIELKKEIE